MKVIKLSENQYMGFNSEFNKHMIKSNEDEIIMLNNCKLISPDGKIVVFCKENGSVEYSYATMRNVNSDLLNNFKVELIGRPTERMC